MTGYAPQQVPVLSAIGRGFATFDHWHCEVPSQTFANRSFYHAATSLGFVVNVPYENFPLHNDAETVFERLDAAGLTWRVYADPGMRMSVTGMIHASRLSRRFATNLVAPHHSRTVTALSRAVSGAETALEGVGCRRASSTPGRRHVGG